MSNILSSDDFGLQLYNRFPPKYREDDVKEKYALKRYIQAMSDGGYKYIIDDINRLTTLIDPLKVDSKYLPVLFKQFGLEIFNGIPEDYLRYLLPKLGEAWSKKGSLDVVEFIVSSISGVKTSTSVSYDSKGNPIVSVRLEMDYAIGPTTPNLEQLNRILQNFVPSFCDSFIVKTYVFYEERTLSVEESKNILNIHDCRTENGGILSGSGRILIPILNNNGKLLNSSFILNEDYEYSLDTDCYKDNIIILYTEKGIADSDDCYADRLYSIFSDSETLNLSCSNKDILSILTSESSIPDSEDYHMDRLSFTSMETSDLDSKIVSDYYSDLLIISPFIEKCITPLKDSCLDKVSITPCVENNILDTKDYHMDNLGISPYTEEVGFETHSEYMGYTNSEFSILNSNFYTNNLGCYNIITMKDGTIDVLLT